MIDVNNYGVFFSRNKCSDAREVISFLFEDSSKCFYGNAKILRFVFTYFVAFLLLFLIPVFAFASENIQDAKILYNQGAEAYQSGDLQATIKAWSEVAEILGSLPDSKKELGACYYNISEVYYQLGKYEESIEKRDLALKIFQTIKGMERDQANCYMNIGAALGEIGRHEEAIAKQEQAIKIYQEIPETERQQVKCYRNIRVDFAQMGKYEEALNANQKALHIIQKITGSKKEQIEYYENIIALYTKVGNYAEAINQCKEALHIYQIIDGTDKQQAECFRNIGVLYSKIGNYDEAIQQYEEALRIFKVIDGTEMNQADCLQAIGAFQGIMGKYSDEIEKQEQALSLFKMHEGTEAKQADCYNNIGVALGEMSKYEQALSMLQKALQLHRQLKSSPGDQADCYKNIGAIMFKAGRYQDGMAQENQALEIYETIEGTEKDRADCYMNIGIALNNTGKFDESVIMYQKALQIYLMIKWTEREQANCYRNIGIVFNDMEKYEEGIANQQMAIKIYKKIKGSEQDIAGCTLNIGGAMGDIRQHEQAILLFQQALELFKASKGTERDQAGCYMNIGDTLIKMCQYKEAIALEKQALQLFQNLGHTENEQIKCHRNIGKAFVNMGCYAEAILQYQQALTICQQTEGAYDQQFVCYAYIGEAYLKAGNYDDAITNYKRAKNEVDAWLISYGLGNAYRSRAKPLDVEKTIIELYQAVQLVEQGRAKVAAFEHRLSIFEEQTKVYSYFVDFLIGLSYTKKKVYFEPWTDDSESNEKLREAAFHFADCGKGRALEDMLRERVRLKSSAPDANLLAEDKELSLRISKLSSLKEGFPVSDPNRIAQLTGDIDQLQQRRNMIEVELKRTALGDYVAPEFRKPMEMAKDLDSSTAVLQYSIGEKEGWLLILAREGVAAYKIEVNTPAFPELLPRQEATLEQLAGVWKTQPDKIGLDGLVRLARARVEDQGRTESQRKNIIDVNQEKVILERLGQVVLPNTALADLRQKSIRHLLIIPDGSLHYVPFAMLRIKDKDNKATQYVIEEFAASSVPAMTTLDTIRKQKQQREQKRKMLRRELLAFANPDFGNGTPLPATDELVTRMRSFRHDYYSDLGLKLTSLPETEAEATRVASLFEEPKLCRDQVNDWPEGRSVVCVSAGASEEQVKRLLAGGDRAPHWRYVLFSTHGMADTRNGMLSCLVLSAPGKNSTEDGLLQAQEVLDMELDTDLVMLSACQTGLGRLSGGEGLVGLSGAFFVSGAETVGASLWQVPSGPTGQLVTEFFKNLKECKVDKAEALRQAQLAVMRKGQSPDSKTADYSDTFCWAAFVLLGEYR